MSAIVLPSNGRPKQIIDIENCTSGRKIQDIVVENDAISLTYYVAELSNNGSVSIKIDEIGHNGENIRTISEDPALTRITDVPINKILLVGNKLRLTVAYSGSTTVDISARAVSASAALLDGRKQTVIIEPTDYQREIDGNTVDLLCKLNDTLEKVLNHNRLITGMERDEGDKF